MKQNGCKWLSWVSIAMVLMLERGAAATAPPSAAVTADEFQLYMDWKEGCEDPRLRGASETSKLKKIAGALGVSPDTLRAAIAKVGPGVEGIGAKTQADIRRTLASTPVGSRIRDVVIDAQQGHVVAGVKWLCGDPRDLEKDAAYAAWSVGKSGHVVKTLVVWCVDDSNTKQFSAKISRGAFGRIRLRSIERFSATRYIRLFEEVKKGPHS